MSAENVLQKKLRKSGLKPEVRLEPSQHEFAQWISESGGSGLGAQPPGHGKTLGSLAAFDRLRQEGTADKALVAVPASLIHNYDEKGIRKFTDFTSHVIRQNSPADPKADVNIVSLERLRKDPTKITNTLGADTLIVDEAHKARGKNTLNYRALREISPSFKNRIPLTATPMMNQPGDMISILDALHLNADSSPITREDIEEKPGPIKSLLRRLTTRPPEHPEEALLFGGKIRPARSLIEKAHQAIWGPQFLSPGENSRGARVVGPNPKAIQKRFGGRVWGLGLESPKEDMPEPVVEDVKVPMTPLQVKAYRAVWNRLTPSVRDLLSSPEAVNHPRYNAALAKFQGARQIMNSTKLMLPGISDQANVDLTPKLQTMKHDLEEHLDKNPDAQVMIYSNFVEHGVNAAEHMVKEVMKKRGLSYGKYLGTSHQNEGDRNKALEDFNAGRHKVLLMSSAGTEGASLPNTTLEMIMDGHWNPKLQEQIQGRGVRLFGLQHRPIENRKVQIKRYQSVLPEDYNKPEPGSFFNRLFHRPDTPLPWKHDPSRPPFSMDERVYQVADQKLKNIDPILMALKTKMPLRTA